MKTYTISFAAAMSHIPEHPERTAYRAVGTWGSDYQFQVWPSRAAMRKSIEMQGRREPHPSDWRDWMLSRMAQVLGVVTVEELGGGSRIFRLVADPSIKAFAGFAGGTPMTKKQAMPLPHVQIFFGITLEDDNIADDLKNTREPARQAYARKWQEEFAEGAGWPQMQNEELVKLEKILGFKVGNVDSEGGEIFGVETVGDVLKIYKAIRSHRGGGDDIIYFDQYLDVGNFILFPEGVTGPRYEFDGWDDFFEGYGINV